MKIMRSVPICTMALAFFAGVLSPCNGATVTFSIGMGDVLNNQGQKVATNSLFQLVKLGNDGQFNQIPAGAWVGGDDTLLSLPFPNSDGWTSSDAFDLTNGIGTAGVFSRQFTFTLGVGLATGDKIGIRWFPTVKATDFATTVTTAGMSYGQFTRQSSPLYGGSTWVVAAAGSLVSFDPMITVGDDPINGLDANSVGTASHAVVVVPETSGIVTGLLCVGVAAWRRKRRY